MANVTTIRGALDALSAPADLAVALVAARRSALARAAADLADRADVRTLAARAADDLADALARALDARARALDARAADDLTTDLVADLADLPVTAFFDAVADLAIALAYATTIRAARDAEGDDKS